MLSGGFCFSITLGGEDFIGIINEGDVDIVDETHISPKIEALSLLETADLNCTVLSAPTANNRNLLTKLS